VSFLPLLLLLLLFPTVRCLRDVQMKVAVDDVPSKIRRKRWE
jgi:hypothetical protein